MLAIHNSQLERATGPGAAHWVRGWRLIHSRRARLFVFVFVFGVTWFPSCRRLFCFYCKAQFFVVQPLRCFRFLRFYLTVWPSKSWPSHVSMLKFDQYKKKRTEFVYREIVEFLPDLSYEVPWWPTRCPKTISTNIKFWLRCLAGAFVSIKMNLFLKN